MLIIIGGSFLFLGLQAGQLTELSLLLTLALVGAATNTFMTANNTAALTALPRRLAGFSSGMLETSRQLGHSIAVALAAGVLGVAAETASGAPTNATASLALSILSFGMIAFVGAGLAAFGGEARPQRRPDLATSASD